MCTSNFDKPVFRLQGVELSVMPFTAPIATQEDLAPFALECIPVP